eukprot:m.260774 g.260774  ORF g.260774 m.260774 type:complete len:1226 (+) comp15565_c1_seq8:214-3891(+)
MAEQGGHRFTLPRTSSVTSLMSLGPDRRHTAKEAFGALLLEIGYEKPAPKSKTAGMLHVVVKEGVGIRISEPYVKLYLSSGGKDLRGTKQKTKPHKKKGNPLFEERLVYYLKSDTNFLDDSNRLQVTLWDHSRLHNECMGGFSLALIEVKEQGTLAGWFQILPERDGREMHEFLGAEKPEDVTTLHRAPRGMPSPSTASRASVRSAKAKGDGAAKSEAASSASKRGFKLFSRKGGATTTKETNAGSDKPGKGKGKQGATTNSGDVPDQDLTFDSLATDLDTVFHRASKPSQPESDMGATAAAAVAATDLLTTDATLQQQQQEVEPYPALPTTTSAEMQDALTAAHDITQSSAADASVVGLLNALSMGNGPSHDEAFVAQTHSQVDPSHVPPSSHKGGVLPTEAESSSDEEEEEEEQEEVVGSASKADIAIAATSASAPAPTPTDKGEGALLATTHVLPTPPTTTRKPRRVQPVPPPTAASASPTATAPKLVLSDAAALSTSSTPDKVSATASTPPPAATDTLDGVPETPVQPHQSNGQAVAQVSSGGGNSGGVMQRAGSFESLISLAPDQIVSASTTKGSLLLTVEHVPGTRGKPPVVKVTVHDSRDLSNVSRPYLKCYLSKNAVDIKSSKVKSSPGAKGTHKLPSPLALSVIVPDVGQKQPIICRLQLSVWDHGRMRANECLGGFSFSLSDIIMKGPLNGWYRLLPYHKGRSTNMRDDAQIESSDAVPAVVVASEASSDVAPHGVRTASGSAPATPPSFESHDATQKQTTAATSNGGADGVSSTVYTPRRPPEPLTPAPSTTAAAAISSQAAERKANQGALTRLMEGSKPPPQTSTEMLAPHHRAGSYGSLISTVSGVITSADSVQGQVCLNMFFSPAETDAGRTLGHIDITVNAARNLSAEACYVKLYLSEGNVNVRSSKHKTKTQRGTRSPVFEQSFKIAIPNTMRLDTEARLQVTVWDYSRLKTNECLGGLSFSLQELASTTTISGWFGLLPYGEGRKRHEDAESASSATQSPSLTRKRSQPTMPLRRSVDDLDDGDDGDDGIGAAHTSAGTIPHAIEGKGSKPKHKRVLLAVGSKALQREIQVLQQQLDEAHVVNERHVSEKAELEAKLQTLRDQAKGKGELKRKSALQQQENEELRARVATLPQLIREKDDVEEECRRMQQMIELMQRDARSHRDTISTLRDKVDDLHDEVEILRKWKAAMLAELEPAKLTRLMVKMAA